MNRLVPFESSPANLRFGNELGRTLSLFDQLFTRGWAVAADVAESEDGLQVILDVPGLDRDDLSIEVHEGLLTISGSRRASEQTSREGYQRIERSYGSFRRQMYLPDTADEEKINAELENGVLKVNIPYGENVSHPIRKIEVQERKQLTEKSE